MADIFASADHLAHATAGLNEDSLRNRTIYNDVVRELEIVGEACKSLTDAFKTQHPDIPWREIVAMRNIIVHIYWEIDHTLVWQAATVDVPELIGLLKTSRQAEP